LLRGKLAEKKKKVNTGEIFEMKIIPVFNPRMPLIRWEILTENFHLTSF